MQADPGSTDAVVAKVREGFRLIGSEPAAVGIAPGRVNLIGEHTDYNAGLCLPMALTQVTAAGVAPRDDDLLRMWSLDLDSSAEIRLSEIGPGVPAGWSGYVAGTVWALQQAGYPVRGMDIVVASEVPVGAGLSSSAALEGAVAAAADAVFGLGLLASDSARQTLVRACQRAENEIVGAPTGGLDQSASLLAREDHALLLDFASHDFRHVPFELGDHVLLVIDTRAHHSLADGQYGKRRAQCEEAAAILGVNTLRDATLEQAEGLTDPILRRRARHVVSEIGRVTEAVAALEAGDLTTLGQLIDASHASLRDDYEVSCEELDVATSAARLAGALGARMTGGGFGGSAIAIVPTELVPAVTEQVKAAFQFAGFTEPQLFIAKPGPGARAAQ